MDVLRDKVSWSLWPMDVSAVTFEPLDTYRSRDPSHVEGDEANILSHRKTP